MHAEEEFDLVVLCVGHAGPTRRPAGRAGRGAERARFRCRRRLPPGEVVAAEGVFVCGAARGAQGHPRLGDAGQRRRRACASQAAGGRSTLLTESEYPPERDVSGEEPRVGAIICRCGTNIGGVVDVPAVVEYAKTLPDVVFADERLYACSQDAQEWIREIVEENDLNRLMVASCTPRTHQPLFRETVRSAGLNKYLFEMANIREHCSWVHMEDPGERHAKGRSTW